MLGFIRRVDFYVEPLPSTNEHNQNQPNPPVITNWKNITAASTYPQFSGPLSTTKPDIHMTISC